MSALSGCEVELGSPQDITTGQSDYSLTALAVAGDSLKVRLALTESLTEDKYEPYEDASVRLRMLMFPDFERYPLDSIIMEKYRTILTDIQADVTAVTGSGDSIKLAFNAATLNYECGYRPKPGERIEVMATIPDSTRVDSLFTVKSNVTVPDWQPQVEIVNYRRVYKEMTEREDLLIQESYGLYTDSVVELTMHIHDTSSDTHCYRLKAMGVGYHYSYILEGEELPETIYWTSAFFSDDPMLYDSQITDMFGPWQAHTTDVFSNRQFKNDAYITVQVRYPSKVRNLYRYIQIELQPITSPLMNYLSSLYRMRVAKQSYYSDYSTLPSNIEGGVGIFGGVGKSTKCRIWLDGDPDPNYPD